MKSVLGIRSLLSVYYGDGTLAGSVSAIRVADTTPDTKVSAAMTHMATFNPNASAVRPASSAPIAYPRSRQRR